MHYLMLLERNPAARCDMEYLYLRTELIMNKITPKTTRKFNGKNKLAEKDNGVTGSPIRTLQRTSCSSTIENIDYTTIGGARNWKIRIPISIFFFLGSSNNMVSSQSSFLQMETPNSNSFLSFLKPTTRKASPYLAFKSPLALFSSFSFLGREYFKSLGKIPMVCCTRRNIRHFRHQNFVKFELKKQSSCSLQLINNTDNYVAFKVKTTSPKKYTVRPNTGILPPKATCDVIFTMQAPKEAPPDMQCKDKFLVQSVIAPSGTTMKDITPEMFNKELGNVIEETKLRVVYVAPPEPPSTIPEPSEEGLTQKDASLGNASPKAPSVDHVPKDIIELKAKLSEALSAISKLAEEKAAAIQQKQKFGQEVEMMKRSDHGRSGMGFSFLFVCFVGLVGIILGYFFNS